MPKLSATELAALDLIIEAKKAGQLPEGFIDVNINNIANDVNNLANNAKNVGEAVVVTAAAVAAVTVVAAGQITTQMAAPAASTNLPKGPGLSLQDLLDLRKRALDGSN